jgi:anti-sigma factor RsiW
MRCEDTTANVADYLAGTLGDEHTAALRRHTASCERCRGEVAAFEHTWQMLGIVTSSRPDTAGMRSRVEAMLAGYQEGIAAGPAPRRWSVAVPLSLGGIAWRTASVAAVLVLGIVVGRTSSVSPASGEAQIAALRQEVGAMREMVSMSLLQQQSAAERLEGVAWTNRLERPGAEVVSALLETLRRDPNVNVRLASIDALKRFGDQEVVRRGALDSLPRQTSPLVQVALIDFVLETNGVESEAILRRLSQDSTLAEAVRTRAVQGLAQLGAQS